MNTRNRNNCMRDFNYTKYSWGCSCDIRFRVAWCMYRSNPKAHKQRVYNWACLPPLEKQDWSSETHITSLCSGGLLTLMSACSFWFPKLFCHTWHICLFCKHSLGSSGNQLGALNFYRFYTSQIWLFHTGQTLLSLMSASCFHLACGLRFLLCFWLHLSTYPEWWLCLVSFHNYRRPSCFD